MKKNTNECSYVIKDDQGMYVGGITERKRLYVYSWSERLLNGFYTVSLETAKMQLDKCKNIAERIKFDKEFHIEEVNIIKIIAEESKLPDDLYPIRYRYIEKELVMS